MTLTYKNTDRIIKMLKTNLLGAAIAAAIASTSVQAAEVMTADPSLKLTYKNYYWNQSQTSKKTDPNHVNGYKRREWVHGIVADFDSGYVNDMVGAVVTAGFVAPLSVKKDTSMTNVSKGSDGKANGIAGFQQAFVKAKYSLGEVMLKGSVGVKKRGTALYGNSGSRLLAASSNGIDLSADVADLNVYATQITSASARNSSVFSRDLQGDGNKGKIDNIRIFGANYTIAGVKLTAETLKSKDFIKKNFAKVAYTVDLADEQSLELDARYGTAADAGKLYKSDDYKSSYYNLNGTMKINDAYVSLGYNKTSKGDWRKDNSVGVNDDVMNSSLDLWAAYALEDEKAYLIKAGYNFAEQGLAGLNVKGWYAKGRDAKDVDNFKRSEYGSYLSYAFEGDLKGLSLAWLHVGYRADGQRNGNAVGGLFEEDVNRLYLKYSVTAF